MANEKKIPIVTITTEERPSTGSSASSLKSPRTARFAEATAVYSPIEPRKSPFADPPTTNHYKAEPQPSDIGFGYLDSKPRFAGQDVEMEDSEQKAMPAATTKTIPPPLKSALKSPGAPPRTAGFENNILSPTFKEEQDLEKREVETEKEQAKDLKVKFRVRMAKMALRSVSCACSLIVLAMLTTVFSIFNATKALAPRSGLPPWAKNTITWPQITMLVIACISLFMSFIILGAYFRGGHRRAEKVAVYYTVFAVAFFIFSIVMWGVGAGILNQSKQNGNGQDMWGWSCKDNRRREIFKDDVQYELMCRLQDWALVCAIIEIVVEVFCIAIYSIVFYRFWSKRKLRKSMATRDRARSDLYLAQLRSQSAPNTPGLGPLSPRSGGWRPPPGHPNYVPDDDEKAAAQHNENVQYPRGFAEPQPFQLMPAPSKAGSATPKSDKGAFVSSTPPPSSPRFERQQEHVPAAPGEQQYASVPIPGAYSSPVASPSFPPQQPTMGGFNFGIPEEAERKATPPQQK